MGSIQDAAKIVSSVQLPVVPQSGTTVQPLLTPDAIYTTELAVIQNTRPGEELYLSQYSLPKQDDGPSVGTPASDAQRQILNAIVSQMKNNNVKVFIVADNSAGKPGEPAHNQATIDYLQQQGANILPYPTQCAKIDHTKLTANSDYAVVTSGNMSAHQADSPDLNTGFVFAGAAATNAVLQAILPQWTFAAREAGVTTAPSISGQPVADPIVSWLNTAPAAETGATSDRTEIKAAYLALIQKAGADKTPGAHLYLEHFDLSEQDVADALVQAKKDNPSLDIRGILDPNMYLDEKKKNPSSGQVTCYNALTQAGILVRFAYVNPSPPGPEGKQFPQQFHNKWMVYSGGQVINGSGNLSFNSLNAETPPIVNPDPNKPPQLNREVDVLVTDSNSAQAFKQKFEDDWNNHATADATTATKGTSTFEDLFARFVQLEKKSFHLSDNWYTPPQQPANAEAGAGVSPFGTVAQQQFQQFGFNLSGGSYGAQTGNLFDGLICPDLWHQNIIRHLAERASGQANAVGQTGVAGSTNRRTQSSSNTGNSGAADSALSAAMLMNPYMLSPGLIGGGLGYGLGYGMGYDPYLMGGMGYGMGGYGMGPNGNPLFMDPFLNTWNPNLNACACAPTC